MRLTTVILIASLMQVSAATFGQRITINQRDANLESVLKEIRKQSGYDYYYDSNVLLKNQQVNIFLTNVPINEALESVFRELAFTYKIVDKTIVIKKKEPSVPDNQLARFQKIDIRGRILDQQKNPLFGATIRVKGTSHSVISNEKGEFLLRNVDEKAVLVVAYIGYTSIEVNATKDLGDIVLLLSDNRLEEVNVMVSTGYQTLPKERATGSFSVIGKEQLEKPAINIAQRLISTTAGMQATLDVDGNPVFEIRGKSTLLGNASPLVVVDGFAVRGDFSSVDPNDVESITVLKDAAAASIWGARAANGVIVIVTKKAKKDMPLKVEFSTFTRVGKKFDLDYVRPLASSNETVDYEIQAYNKWRTLPNPSSFYNYSMAYSLAGTALNEYNLGQITQAERDATLQQLRTQDNRDQISQNLLSNPVNQQYHLSLQGASNRMNNALSLLYQNNQSNFKGTDSKEYMVNYRTSASVFKWLDFNFSGMLQYNKAKNNGVSLFDIQNMSPYEMLVNKDGSLTNVSRYYWPIIQRFVPTSLFPYADWTYNPIQEIKSRENTSDDLNTRLQAGLTFKLMKGLTLDSKIQYELFNTNTRNLNNEQSFYVRNMVNRASSWDMDNNQITLNLPKGSILDQNRRQGTGINFRNQVNFDRSFGKKHEINFVAGTEVNKITNELFLYPTSYGYNDETLSVGTFPNGPGGNAAPILDWEGFEQNFFYTTIFAYSTEKYFSVFGNAAYTYDGKYTLSGSYRTDASNFITDDPKYRYDPFWSVGAGWQLDREAFMENVKWVDRLNLRATYGYNGNVDRSTAFRPLIGLSAAPNVYTNNFTAVITSYGNPSLRWERTGSLNFGVDYSLLKGKLFGKVDLYHKSGKDLIAQLSIPAINGTTSQRLNNAAITNRGIELELGTFLKIKGNDIIWRGSVNFAYNTNKIKKLFVANYPASTLVEGGTGAYVEGQNANSIWRYEYGGVVNKQPTVNGPGDTKYNFGTLTPGDGRDYLLNMGTTVAPYTVGLNSAFKIYDFDVSFIITGKFGHVFQRMGFNYPATFTSRVLPNSKLSEVMNGDPMKIAPLPLNDNEPRYFLWDGNYPYLNYLIENASHIRMQEVNVTYGLPVRMLSKFKVSRLNVFAQGNDLFTVLFNDSGEDPEFPLGTMKPRLKATLGLRLEF